MEIGGRHIKDVDSVGEDEDCVEGYKRRTILNEGHITRDTDATRRRIIAAISFMLRTITKKAHSTDCADNLVCSRGASKT